MLSELATNCMEPPIARRPIRSPGAHGAASNPGSSAALAALTGTPFTLGTNTDGPGNIATEPTSRTLLVADTTGNLIETFSAGNSPASSGTTTFASVNAIAVDPQGTYAAAFGSNAITVAQSAGSLERWAAWTLHLLLVLQ